MAEEHKGFFRRITEWLGHIHLATWLWMLAVSIVNGGAVAYLTWWQWATQFGYVPIYLAALLAFAVSIWIINGFIWLRGQRRPSPARISFDYAHSLALEHITCGLDQENAENTLEIRPMFRNVANGPIKFNIEKMSTQIEDRIVTIEGINGVIPHGIQRTIIPNKGFSKKAYEQFKNRTNGTLEYDIVYGHPDDKPSRRTTSQIHIDIFKRQDDKGKPTVALNWIVRTVSDVSIP